MRTMAWLIAGLLLAAPAAADMLLTTQHFGSYAEVEPLIGGGLEFFARGDTDRLSITVPPDPPQEQPFNLWNDGIPHAFKVVYNAGGIAGLSIDDEYTIQAPATIDPATNGLLITAFSDVPGGSVVLQNLRITLPGFIMYTVNDDVQAPAADYMLLTTDLALVNGFILSGTVTFEWDGSLPVPTHEWFEVAPVVVIPEPAAASLILLGGLALIARRR